MWTIFGTASFAISQFLLIIVISKYGTMGDLGYYTLSLSLSSPIMLYSNLQLGQILITDYGRERDFYTYKKTLIFSLIVGMILLLIISLFYIKSFSDNSNLLYIIFVFGLLKALDSISDLYLAYSQRNLENDKVGKVRVVRSLINLLSFSIIFIMTTSILISLISQVILSFLRYQFYDKKKIKIKENPKKTVISNIKNTYILGIPLGMVALINSINSNIPTYFLDIYSNINLVAVLNTLLYVFVIGNIIISPLTMYLSPTLSKRIFKKEKKMFKVIVYNACLKSLVLSIPLLIVIVLFSNKIISLVFNEYIANYSYLLTLLAIAIIFNFLTAVFNVAIISLKLLKIQPFINVICTTFILMIGFYSIQNYSITGAVYVLLSYSILQNFLSFLVMYYGFRKFQWNS